MVLLNLQRGCFLKIVDVHICWHMSLRTDCTKCRGIFATYHSFGGRRIDNPASKDGWLACCFDLGRLALRGFESPLSAIKSQ